MEIADHKNTLLMKFTLSSYRKELTMSVFKSILEKLGLKKAEAPAPPPAAAKAAPAPTASVKPTPGPQVGYVPPPRPAASVAPQPAAAPHPAPMEMVDVVSKLDKLAKESPIPLNWKESIVDLLVLLKIDHSADSIKELAVELGCPEDLMSNSARRNMWLHKTVMQKIAENGGNIPQSLLK
jgi:Domain of unknown function (DUF3597)